MSDDRGTAAVVHRHSVCKDVSRSVILHLRLTWSGYEFGDTLDAVSIQLKQQVEDQQTNTDLS